MTTRTAMTGHVDVSAALLWAAGWRAREEQDTDLADRIAAAFERKASSKVDQPTYRISTLGQRPRTLMKLASSGMLQTPIRFSRDPLDIGLAAVLSGNSGLAEFKLYSERSVVEAGFFRVRREVEYVERVADKAKDDPRIVELLPTTLRSKVLDALKPFETNPSTLVAPEGGEAVLLLEAQGLQERFSGSSVFQCTLELLDPNRAGRPGQRRLGKAKLKGTGRGMFELSGLSPEAILEVTAASVAAQWIYLESERLRLIGRLPDLTVDGSSSPAYLTPAGCFGKLLDEHDVVVPFPSELARTLHSRFSWFAPGSSVAWVKLSSTDQ
jgi:hypothetical protein